MRNVFRSLAAVAILAVVVVMARAEDAETKTAKKVTLKGEIGCAKCVFKVEGVTKCTNAIKVKEDGKDVVYLIDDKGKGEKYHGKICTEGKEGSVTGVVTKKGDQMMIKPATGGVKFND